jgi:four helix bundle protein
VKCGLIGKNIMPNENLKQRTKRFALRIIRLVERLPETKTSNVIGNQILRSGTSIGANYRAGCLAKSKKDFINKLKIVEEEADETIYWLELLEESGVFPKTKLFSIKQEACEIFSVIVASIKTARKNQKPPS